MHLDTPAHLTNKVTLKTVFLPQLPNSGPTSAYDRPASHALHGELLLLLAPQGLALLGESLAPLLLVVLALDVLQLARDPLHLVLTGVPVVDVGKMMRRRPIAAQPYIPRMNGASSQSRGAPGTEDGSHLVPWLEVPVINLLLNALETCTD